MKKDCNSVPDILLLSRGCDAVDMSCDERDTQQDGEGLPDGDDVGHDQDKKVLVADPDVLSFNVVDHKMQFAGLSKLLVID